MGKYIAIDLGEEFFGGAHPLRELGGVSELVSALTSNLLIIAGIVFIFIVITAGIQMVSAAGDPKQFERAKSLLTTGVVGIILVASAWLIIEILERVLDTNILF